MCLRAYGYQPQERFLAAARLENFHHQTASYVCKGDTHKIPSLVIISSLTPPKKQTVTKVLLLQMTFLNNDLCSAQYHPCQLLLCLNPANFPSPHSITVRFSHSSSILHPLTYAHILTDIAFTSLSFSREWTEMKGLPWNGCAVVIRDWTNTPSMSLSVALSRGPNKEQ